MGGNDVSLFNPLTRALIRFPPLTIAWDVINLPLVCNSSSSPTEWLSIDPTTVTAAGIDDSTSPSTLVLCLRAGFHPIVCAKPGDKNWAYGRFAEQRTAAGMVTPVQSPVTFGGRCYLTTAAGAIVALDLNLGAQCPLMTFLLDEDPPVNTKISSFLVRSQGRMLMVRYMFGAILLEEGGYDETEILMWARRPPHVEVFEVDVAGRRLVAKSGIGDDHTAFLRKAHSFMVSTKKFPKIAANSVYLNYSLQQPGHSGAYHFRDHTTTPPRFSGSRNGRIYPCASHWELEDYLVRDVEMDHYKINSGYWGPPS
jgi:hypothetical protein